MAYWDSRQGKIIRQETEPYPGYPGWAMVDCGCSHGLSWGGESPSECPTCGGEGRLARHLESGVLALYPGGPLMGKEVPSGYRTYVDHIDGNPGNNDPANLRVARGNEHR
jgi:hypothetical protein